MLPFDKSWKMHGKEIDNIARRRWLLLSTNLSSLDWLLVNSHFSTFARREEPLLFATLSKKGVGCTLGAFWGCCRCLVLSYSIRRRACCPGIFLLVAVDKNVLFVLPTWKKEYCTPKPADHVKLFYLELLVVVSRAGTSVSSLFACSKLLLVYGVC